MQEGHRLNTGAKEKTIAPFESFLVREAAKKSPRPELPTIRIDIPEKLTCRRLGRNYLRLDRWEMELNGMKREISAAPLINQIDEGDFPWRPGVQHYFGWMPDLKASPQTAIYRYFLTLKDSFAAENTELMIEPGSLRGKWEIRINGSAPPDGQ